MSTDVARSPTGLHVRFLDGPIDPPSWSWAEWVGVGYLTDPSGQVPPSLGLVFNKPGHGRRIFRSWRARFGSDGADAVLRVAVIEGPVAGYSPGYFVHLGADPVWAAAQAPIGRPAADPLAPVAGYVVHRATPPAGTDHLAAFKAALARHGWYTLVPVLWGGCRFEPVLDLAVRMTRIQLREAADIAAADIDRVCFGHEQGPGPGQKIGGERDGRQVSSIEVHRRWS